MARRFVPGACQLERGLPVVLEVRVDGPAMGRRCGPGPPARLVPRPARSRESTQWRSHLHGPHLRCGVVEPAQGPTRIYCDPQPAGRSLRVHVPGPRGRSTRLATGWVGRASSDPDQVHAVRPRRLASARLRILPGVAERPVTVPWLAPERARRSARGIPVRRDDPHTAWQLVPLE